MECILRAPDGSLQAVLDAAHRRFGDPNGKPFPTDEQLAEAVEWANAERAKPQSRRVKT